MIVKGTRDSRPSCAICHEILGKERLDGEIEYASMLPCSHVFGSICISRVRVPYYLCRIISLFISCLKQYKTFPILKSPIHPSSLSYAYPRANPPQWLENDSLHQDCPLCRRSMVYRECGHIIKSCGVDRAPKCVREKDMPKKCFTCRGAERLDQEMKLRREGRKLGEDRPRQGLTAKMHLPWALRRSRANSLEWNVEEFRRDWRAEIDAIFGNVEQDRRDQW